ncbi:MAG: hypothetical protein HY698_07740 [Deltaproteobacteria bacterium]|nr:hypothetical protein [Deltaproteobacteria bacterium]
MRIGTTIRNCIILGLVIAAPIARAQSSDIPAKLGKVTGTITFSGTIPEKKQLQVTKDQKVCGATPIYDESLAVGEKRGLANVVVFLEGLPKDGATKPMKITLDQSGCRYVPHVQAATVGSKLVMKNSDNTFHTVHSYLGSETMFNVPTVSHGSMEQVLEESGPVRLSCDAGHTWMGAWVYVLDHPFFAVTSTDGTFVVDGVPPGVYTVKAWHEKLGLRSGKVKIQPGSSSTLNLSFK